MDTQSYKFIADGYSRACGKSGVLVYFILAEYYVKKYKTIRPTQEQIAEHFCGSRYVVAKGINALEKFNILKVTRSSYKKFGNLEYEIQDVSLWIPMGKNYGQVKNLTCNCAKKFNTQCQNFQLCRVAKFDSNNKEFKKDNIIYKKEIKKKEEYVEISDMLISQLESSNKIQLDGSKRDNLKYAKMLIKYKIIPAFKQQNIPYSTQSISQAFQHIVENADPFHRKNMTNFKYIYTHFAKITMSQSDNKIINLDEYE